MKKTILTTILAAMMLGAAANPVDLKQAEQAAQAFWKQEYGGEVTLRDRSGDAGLTEIYLFEAVGQKGYVVVAGDDAAHPILGNSDRNDFPTESMSPEARYWLRYYEREIAWARENRIGATEGIRAEWEALKEGKPLPEAKAPAVDPMLTSVWNQGTPYNQMCPGNAPVGCVATALTQIMRYWKYPEHGTGYHEYTYADRPDSVVHWPYGVLSADFEHTYYDWENMPDTLKASSDSIKRAAVATLAYQCGVALDMIYSAEGSGAFVVRKEVVDFDTVNYSTEIAAEVVIPQYFGYTLLEGRVRDNHTLSEWITMLQEELVLGHPVLLAGDESDTTTGGHAFVVDGCTKRQKFHLNFGWGGSYDGEYYVDAIDPARFDFNHRQSALFKMYPPTREGIETAEEQEKISVWSHNRTIEIAGCERGELYDLMGRKIAAFDANGSGKARCTVEREGIYIVRTQGAAKKVYVR